MGEINRISSFNPRKKMMTEAPRKYCKPGVSAKETIVETDNMSAAKIPMPPKDGMGVKCIFRSSGRSNNFFASAILMTTGIDVNATIKETREAKRTKPIFGILGYG
jgi:hypothetical protein